MEGLCTQRPLRGRGSLSRRQDVQESVVLTEDQIKGISFTTQDLVRQRDIYEKRRDPTGNVYYWLAEERPVEESKSNTDLKALMENCKWGL